MTQELAVVEGQVTVSDEQKDSRVYAHPERETIHQLIRVGKSAFWISRWLEQEYPVEDAQGLERDDAAQNKRWRVSEKVLEGYRAKFMPEHAPGVDVVSEELDDLIGRRLPAPAGPAWEIQVIEKSIHVAEDTVVRAVSADKELGMVQQASLDANRALLEAAQASVGVKQRLGVEGYEAQPEHHIVESTNKHMSVELHGRIDPRTGQAGPGDPKRVDALTNLFALPPGEAAKLMAAADALAAEAEAQAVVADPEEPSAPADP